MGTHPIFESDFDCLTVIMADGERIETGVIIDDITEPAPEEEVDDEVKSIPGVIFISSIPRGMGPIHVRQFMVKFGELGRIYLAPRDRQQLRKNTHRYAVDDYKEGWVETKKKSKFSGVLWNIKYLHKTRWHHLTEQLVYEEQTNKQKMRAEVAQAKRVTAQVEKNFDASKKQLAIVERKRAAGVDMKLGKVQIKQRKVVAGSGGGAKESKKSQ